MIRIRVLMLMLSMFCMSLGIQAAPPQKQNAQNSDESYAIVSELLETRNLEIAASLNGNKAIESSGVEEKEEEEEEETKTLREYSYEDIIFAQLYHPRTGQRVFIEAIYDDAGLFISIKDFLDFGGFIYEETDNGVFDIQLGNGVGNVRANFRGLSMTRQATGDNIGQADDFARIEDVYFISERLLKQLFSVSIDFNRNRLIIEIEAENLFPHEIREQRAERRSRLNQSDGFESSIIYEEVQDAYKFIDVPFIDLYTRNYIRSSGRSEEVDYNWNYSVRGAGDVGFLNSEWSLHGRNTGELDRVRFKAGRKSATPDLLGIRATSFYLGDLSAPRISGLTNGAQGRGFEVSNFPLQRSRNFTSTNITGTVQPGWEVELYRGRELIDYVEADENGMYTFTDIVLNYGRNTFKVVSYGPQGETEEQVVNRYIGSDMIQPGKFYYSASFTQHRTSLIEPSSGRFSNTTEGSPRLFTEIEAGLSSRLSLHSWVYSIPLDVEDGMQHTYLASGLRTTFGQAGLQGSFIKDLQSGYALRGQAQTRLPKKWYLSGSYIRMFNDFLTESDLGTTQLYQSKSQASIRGSLPLKLRTRLRLSDYRFNGGAYKTRLTHTLQRSIMGIRLNNHLYFRLRGRNDRTTQTSGLYRIRYNINRHLVRRSEIKYETRPETRIREINTGISWQHPNKFNMQVRTGRQFGRREEVWFGSVNMQRHFGMFRASINARYDTGRRFSAGFSVSASLARNPVNGQIRAYDRPITRSAGIATNIYNEVPDTSPGRVGIDEAELVLGESGKALEADNNGIVFSTNIRSWYPTEVSVEESSLRDPAMIAPPSGLSYLSRPGKIFTRELQISIAGEIEGLIYQTGAAGREENIRPVSDVPVVLIETSSETDDTKQIDEKEETTQSESSIEQRMESEFDGQYFFDFIEEGQYRISVDSEWMADRNLHIISDTEEFNVTGDGTRFRETDIILAPVMEEINFEADALLVIEKEREALRQNLAEQGLPIVCGQDLDIGDTSSGSDQDAIDENSLEVLQQHTNLMNQYPELKIIIESASSQPGSLGAGQNQSALVQQTLVDLGVEPDRIVLENQSQGEDDDETISIRYAVSEMVSFDQDDPTLTEKYREQLALNMDIMHICQQVNMQVGASSDYLNRARESSSVIAQRRDEVLEFYIDQGLPDSDNRLNVEMGANTRFDLPAGMDSDEGESLDSSLRADRSDKTYTIQLGFSETREQALAQMQALSANSGLATMVYYNPETSNYLITADVEGSAFQVERKLYSLRQDLQFRSAFLIPLAGIEEQELDIDGDYEVHFGVFSSEEAAGRVRDYINSFSSEQAVVVYSEREDVYRVIARNALERDEAAFIIDEARRNGHNDLLILRLSELE